MVRISVKYPDGIWRTEYYKSNNYCDCKNYAQELCEMFSHLVEIDNILGYTVEVVTNTAGTKIVEIIGNEEKQ